ncbi:uncharacterized protein [Solanum tuberosum]|uniref:uncharacterized protein n=1 Tax=Solanum tuberosum TaxID=4113 RepID=UPI00073A2006|nr:PREDICTED: uncharacterized protein LOC107062188 [Solanum tuberosum]
MARNPKQKRSSVHMYVKWNPPVDSNIMLNTDSGFDSASGLSTLGGTCPTSKPLETEMRALLLGLALALQYEIMHLEINIDSLQYLLRRMGDTRVSHVYREQNKLADALVAVAITTIFVDNNTMLFWNSPASLTDILRADKNGELYSRRVQVASHSSRLMFNTSSARQVVHTSSASSVISVVAQPQLLTL